MTLEERITTVEELFDAGLIDSRAAVKLIGMADQQDPFDPNTWNIWGTHGYLGPSSKPADPKPKAGDVLKVKCKRCGNEGHVTVWKVADGKVHATCKLCGKEVTQ